MTKKKHRATAIVQAQEKSLQIQSMDAFVLKEQGDAAQNRGELAVAQSFYQKAIKIRPQFAAAHYELGQTYLREGKHIEAANAYWLAWLHFGFRKEAGLMCGRALALAALWQECCAVFERIPRSDIDPGSALFYANALRAENRIREALEILSIAGTSNEIGFRRLLGACYVGMGWCEKARPLLESALDYKDQGFTVDQLISVYYTLQDYEALRNVIKQARKNFPKDDFYLASDAVVEIVQDGKAPSRQALECQRKELVESALYIAQFVAKGTQITGNTYQTFDVVKPAILDDGLILEFGVRHGHTIHRLAEMFPSRTIHGFDSFQGLPEQWHNEDAGSYTTRGRIPKVPGNVEFHIGWFSDTLPEFKKEHSGSIAFMNVDCDLYSATKTIFDELDAQIIPGTVIVFDEYLGNKTWRLDEFKAFQEWVAAHGVTYQYLAASFSTKQAAVKILSRCD